MTGFEQRAMILAEARSWIQTPYLHQASNKGIGCDCLGLVRGVWRALYGAEPEALPPYSPDWAERHGAEILLLTARRWLREVPTNQARPGDVLLFRPQANAPAKHCAILGRPDTIIHAYWGKAVAETSLSKWWLRRLVAVFQFPSQVN
jgi:NlpC/P60 family putative phage cell wall peptidase